MDGDRPVAERRDLLESKIQNIIYEAVVYGRYNPHKAIWELECEGIGEYFERLHELLVSYFDSEASDVGPQDETSEARDVGVDFRPEADLKSSFKPTVFDDITDDFTKKMSLRFHPEGIKPIGHCKLEKTPDGSIHASIKYF